MRVVTPLLGYVKSVETLVPAPDRPASMADSPDAAAAVMTQAFGTLPVGLSGLMGLLASKLASGSTHHADPATAEQVRVQMTAMLQDPKVANTPTATFLEAFLHSAEQQGAV